MDPPRIWPTRALTTVALHTDAFQVVAFFVVVTLDVHQVDRAEHCRYVHQRQLARRRDTTRGNHLPKLTCRHPLRRTRAKQHSHDSIDWARWATALRMTQNHGARFVRRFAGDSPR